MGYILLEGGAEFQGQMDAADRRAIELAGGSNARVHIIPAAAAPDNNDERAGRIGVNWFRRQGVRQIKSLPVIDHRSAEDPSLVDELTKSDLTFLLGGFPGHLAAVLKDSLCWKAMNRAFDGGGIIAGSSAGAMVLGEFFYDPSEKRVTDGLNLLPGVCLVPHHETFGQGWVFLLQPLIPDTVIIGIDEQTGILNDGPGGAWRVYGKGAVTVYRDDRKERFSVDQPFTLY